MLLLCALIAGSGSAWAEDTWVETAPTDLETGDVVIIVDQTSKACLPNTAVSKAPSASTTVTFNGDKSEIVSDVTASMLWDVTIGTSGDTRTYQFSVTSGATTNYLACKNDNNGVAVNGGSESGFDKIFIWDSSVSKLKSSTLTRWIGVYTSNPDWRCYTSSTATNIKNTVMAFYKKTTVELSSIAISGTYPTVFLKNASFSHEGMTVTATYGNGSTKDVTTDATFSGYDMSTTGEQDVTVSYTENEVTKTATYKITVNEPQAFTVTFSDGGSITEASAGAGITLPSREDVASYTFRGWSESNIASATTTTPTILTGTYSPAGNITLYPVYSYSAGSYANEWVEINAVPEEGTYAICSSSNFMKASVTSNRFDNGSATPSIADGKLVAAPTSDCTWEFIKSGDYFLIKNGSNYAAGTGSNNQGKLVTDATGDNVKWTVAYDEGFTISNYGQAQSSKNSTLRNNGTYGWATYAASTGSAPRLFKKTQGVVVATYYVSTPATATISVNSACTDGKGNYYGTYSNSTAFVVPAGLTVTEIEVIDGKLQLTSYDESEIVPANTGVMVSSETSGDHIVALTTGGTSRLGEDNLLIASGDDGVTAADMDDTDYYYYRLTMADSKPGFWWKSEDGAGFVLAANKAYLKVLKTNATASARGFSLFDDETTGITSTAMQPSTVQYYDLQGRRVAQPTKGLYIVNGKKVIKH